MIQKLAESFSRHKKIMGNYLLIASALSLAAIAQYSLSLAINQPNFWEINTWLVNPGNNASPLFGLVLYCLAGILFARAINEFGIRPAQLFLGKIGIIPQVHFGFWATSLGLAMVTALFLSQANSTTSSIGFGIVWLISILLLIISVAIQENWRIQSLKQLPGFLNQHKSELFVIITIIITAFLLRFLDLELHPYSFINDEGEMGLRGACLVDGSCIQILDNTWSSQLMLAFLPTGISLAIFGKTAFAVRLVSAITGTLSVLAIYLFTRDTINKKAAWVAALFLSALPVHVHFSRIGVDNIVDSLTTPTILWLLFRGAKRGNVFYFLTAGIISGLCFYTYPGSRLAPFIGMFAILVLTLSKKDFLHTFSRHIIIFVLAFLVTVLPAAGYFLAHYNEFAARMTSVTIFGNNNPSNEIGITITHALKILPEQFLKSSLVYIVTESPSNFYNSQKPYLVPIAAVAFMLGMTYIIKNWKDPRYNSLFVWFWAAIILGSTITGGPPTSQRMLMSTSALAVITALGICTTTEILPIKHFIWRWTGPLLLLSFVLFTGYQNIQFYFSEYRLGHNFEDPANELTYETNSLISELGDSGRFYLLAEEEVPYLIFGSFKFFSPGVEKTYFNTVTPENLAALPVDQDALFIATPARKSDIEYIASLIPGGNWQEFKRRYQPDITLFYSYKINSSLILDYVR